MTARDLKARYGGNTKMAINRAVRAEIPGGARVLDELEYWSSQVNLHSETGHAETAFLAFSEIANEMKNEIARRYGMQPKN